MEFTTYFGLPIIDTSPEAAHDPLPQIRDFQIATDTALHGITGGGAGDVALADPAGNGMVVRTALGVTVARTLTAPAAGFTISNNDGVAGNPTFALAHDLAALEALAGTGIARRTGADAWSLGALVSGDIPDLSGTYQPLDGDLSAIAALAGTNGLARKTAANTWSLDTNTYATQAYADALVLGLLDDRGNYDASGNTFPASGGSGSAGAILKGDLWTISVAGTLGGHPVTAGDVVRSLADTPGQTDANWAIGENNFGYVALNQALADGKIYVGNGSGIGTAVTPSGDVTITNAGVTAIGALKVTNAMLAGSIAASKLVGTDIATVGTIIAGTWQSAIIGSTYGGTGINNAGRTLTINTNSGTLVFPSAAVMTFPSTSATLARTDAANTFTGNQTFVGNILASLPDTSEIGSATVLFKKGWIAELDSVVFAESTISVLGGWLMIAKGEGKVAEDIDNSETEIDFGTNNIATNDFILFRAAGAVEYMQATSLVSGTVWNVTRNVDGSGANAWPQGSVYVNLGYNGTGRIELNANSTPRISLLAQGTSYNAQAELLRIGDLNGGWGYSSTEYGLAVGDYAAGNYVTVDDGGMTIKAVGGNLTINSTGLKITQGLTDANAVTWLDSSTVVAQVTGFASGNNGTLFLYGKAKTSAGLSSVYIGDPGPSGPKFELTVGGSTHATLPNQGYALLGTGSEVAFNGLAIYNESTLAVLPTTLLHLGLRDAATNGFSDVVTLIHQSTGTPAANFGSSLLFKLSSASVNNRDAARIGTLWTTATDASRTSAFVIQTVNNAAALAEVARFNASGLTLPNITAGSVLFAGTGGLVSQDNASLFWDDANNRLGIGTVIPDTRLEVRSTTAGTAFIRVYDNSAGAATSALPTLQFGVNSSNGFSTSDAARIWTQSTGAATAELRFGVYPDQATAGLTLSSAGVAISSSAETSLTTAGGIRERGRSVSMGIRTDVAYAGANFTKDAGTWTVDSGDQVSFSYIIIGKTMFVTVVVDTSSVGSTASPWLQIKIPGGFTSTARSDGQCYYSDNGTRGVGLMLVLSGTTNILLLKTDLSNWTNSTNLTAVSGTMMIYI